jgi:hypothetical protein
MSQYFNRCKASFICDIHILMYVYFCSLLGAFAKFRKPTISFVMSVCPSASNNSATTGWIFMKFYIRLLFDNLWIKFKFHSNLIKITGTLHEELRTFMIISLSILIRTSNVADKICG